MLPSSAERNRLRPLHPSQQAFLDPLKMTDAVPQQRGAEHGHVGTHHQQFDDVLGAVHTAGRGQAGVDAAIKNADPGQRKPQRLGGAEQHVGLDFQLMEIDVWLIKAIEQRESIRTGIVKALCHVGQLLKKGLSLTATGMVTADFTALRISIYCCSTAVEVSSGSVGIE